MCRIIYGIEYFKRLQAKGFRLKIKTIDYKKNIKI